MKGLNMLNGCCIFCGQIVAVEAHEDCTPEMLDELATEECDINATQNGSETRHSETNCRNMEHIQQRFERVM